MKTDDLCALVEQRRSIRGYDENREVSDEMVRSMIAPAGPLQGAYGRRGTGD